MRFFQRFSWVVLAALFPIMAGFFLKVPRVALGCFTDAVFYLAYARHFGELALRYGLPYYATRFGGILPDALSGTLFGEIDGIWILRYGLAIAVSVALFLLFRKRYGVLAGLLASLLWSFNPAALRLLCTTYVDSTAIPFLILGCCLFASGWGGNIGALLAGILVALASSAHLYAAFALFLLIPWFLAALWGDRPVLIHALCWMAVGFLGTFFAGCLWYWIVWGMPSLFSPTLEVMRDLGGGQAALWKRPLAVALSATPAWFAPVVLLVPVVCAVLFPTSNGQFPALNSGVPTPLAPPGLLLKSQSNLLLPVAGFSSALIRGVALSLLASIGFFWGGDLFGRAYVLSMPFYYSFLLPVTILAGATLCGELLASQKGRTTRLLLFLGLLLAVVGPSFLAYFNTLSISHDVQFCVAVMLLLWPVWNALQQRLLLLLSLIGIASASFLVASTGIFSDMLGHYPSHDIPVLELVSALRRELPKAVEDARVMRFWYDDDPGHPGGTDRRMIGSFWLHIFGKLTGKQERYVPFPDMSVSDAAAISASGVERLVLFDQDANQVTKAVEVIRERSLPFQISKRVTLSAPSDSSRKLEAAILERVKSGANDSSVPMDLHRFQVVNHGVMAWQGDAGELTSGTIRWWEFAKLPLGELRKGEGLRLRFKIEQGMICFMLHDDKERFSEHVGKWLIAGEQEVVLAAPQDLHDASLSLENIYPNGSRSRLLLEKVEKIAAPVP